MSDRKIWLHMETRQGDVLALSNDEAIGDHFLLESGAGFVTLTRADLERLSDPLQLLRARCLELAALQPEDRRGREADENAELLLREPPFLTMALDRGAELIGIGR